MNSIKRIFYSIAIGLTISPLAANANPHDFYQIKVYHLKNNDQVDQVDQYLKDAYYLHCTGWGLKVLVSLSPLPTIQQP